MLSCHSVTIRYPYHVNASIERMIQTQPFLKKISHEIPSERNRLSTGIAIVRHSAPLSIISEGKTKRKKKRLSFTKLLKKLK